MTSVTFLAPSVRLSVRLPCSFGRPHLPDGGCPDIDARLGQHGHVAVSEDDERDETGVHTAGFGVCGAGAQCEPLHFKLVKS